MILSLATDSGYDSMVLFDEDNADDVGLMHLNIEVVELLNACSHGWIKINKLTFCKTGWLMMSSMYDDVEGSGKKIILMNSRRT